MIRYAVYDKFSESYVGHRTSYYNYTKKLPEYMITRNYPAVGPEHAKLYVRESDAENLISILISKLSSNRDRFEIEEFCFIELVNPVKNKYYVMN